MTLQTWLDEFYPTPANSVRSSREAAEHSLRKWEGLRAENLAKHKVDADSHAREIFDERDARELFVISGDTCALCQLFADKHDCNGCPLARVLGNRCDIPLSEDQEDGVFPYAIWSDTGDPSLMIIMLKEALRKTSDDELRMPLPERNPDIEDDAPF